MITDNNEKTAIISAPNVRSSDIIYQALPAKAQVIRFGKFFAEAELSLGDKVDYYFLDSENLQEMREISNEIRSRRYQFSIFLYQQNPLRSTLLDMSSAMSMVTPVDINMVLAERPAIAQLLVSGYSPSEPVLLLAWALLSGFRTVFLLTPDFNPRSPDRYPLVEARAAGRASALSQAQVAADLYLIETLRKDFPAARIFDATKMQNSIGFFERAPKLQDEETIEPLPKPGIYPVPGKHFFGLRTHPVSGIKQRCAYVTYCDSEHYFWGCRALANSLGHRSDIPLIVLVPAGFAIPSASRIPSNMRFLSVPRIRAKHVPKDHQARFANTYSKLNVFGLDFLDKAVFIDSDAIVLRDIDELFDLDHFAAARDHGIYLSEGEFNSGVFVCQPNTALFEDLLKQAEVLDSRDAGDQGFLNSYFKEPSMLPQHFNVLKRVARSMPSLFRSDEISILHYVGDKPWNILVEDGWDALDRMWFDTLTEVDKVDFIFWMRKQAQALTKKPKPARPKPATPKPSFKRAKSAYTAGDLEAAEQISRAALANEPTSTKNMRLLRRIYFDRSQFLRAAKMHWRILKSR